MFFQCFFTFFNEISLLFIDNPEKFDPAEESTLVLNFNAPENKTHDLIFIPYTPPSRLIIEPTNVNLENVSGSAGEFGNLLSGLQYDSAFEKCVNDVLNTATFVLLKVKSNLFNFVSQSILNLLCFHPSTKTNISSAPIPRARNIAQPCNCVK